MAVTGSIWRFVPLVVAITYASPTAADDRAASPAGGREPSIHGASDNGEDLTRPLNRFDLRQSYERLPDDGGLTPEKWVTTLSTDLWAGIGRGSKLYGRADLPFVYSNDVTSSFNPNGHARFGVGDLLTEAAIFRVHFLFPK